MINSRNELKETIKYEKNLYFRNTKFYFMKLFINTPKNSIWKFQIRLRKTEYYKNTNKKILYILSKLFLYNIIIIID